MAAWLPNTQGDEGERSRAYVKTHLVFAKGKDTATKGQFAKTYNNARDCQSADTPDIWRRRRLTLSVVKDIARNVPGDHDDHHEKRSREWLALSSNSPTIRKSTVTIFLMMEFSV